MSDDVGRLFKRGFQVILPPRPARDLICLAMDDRMHAPVTVVACPREIFPGRRGAAGHLCCIRGAAGHLCCFRGVAGPVCYIDGAAGPPCCFGGAAGPLCCYGGMVGHFSCSRSEAGHLSCFRFHARLSLVAISRPRTHAGHGRRKGRMLNDLFVFVDEELRRNVQSSWHSSIITEY